MNRRRGQSGAPSGQSEAGERAPNPVLRWIDGGVWPAEALHALYAGAAACASDDAPLMLWLRTDEPHVSVGASQNAHADLDLDGCRARGLPVVRRVLGGGAVWVDADQDCFFLIQPRRALARGHRHLFAQGLGIAVRALTLALSQATSRNGGPSPGGPLPRIEGQDLWVGERKVMGSGAATVENGCVFGASLMTRFPVDAFLGTLRERSPGFREWLRPSLARRVAGLQDVWPVTLSALRDAVRAECERRFAGGVVDALLGAHDATRWLEAGRAALADLEPLDSVSRRSSAGRPGGWAAQSRPATAGEAEHDAGRSPIPDGLRIHRDAFAFDTATAYGRLRVELERGQVVRLGAGPDWDPRLDLGSIEARLCGVCADRMVIERALGDAVPAEIASELARRIDRLARAVRAL